MTRRTLPVLRLPSLAIVMVSIAAALMSTVAAGPDAAETGKRPAIANLAFERTDSLLRVSLQVENALDDATLERVDSGIAVAFQHQIDVLARRGWLLSAKVVSRTTVEVQVEYDSLTERYSLSRVTRYLGRERKRREPLSETRVTDSAEEMRRWLTRLEAVDLHLPERLPRADRLRVHAETSIGRRYVMWIFPASLTVSADRPFGG